MKTSSSVGRETLTERIGTPSSANRRGTNSSPAGTQNVTAPSAIVRLEPEALARARRSRPRRRRCWICTRSVPTCALSASGVSSATISPLVHDRDAVAELGLVHVVRGHEDRDLLALLQLADVAPDRAARLRVEADRRLVEEQHARRVQQPARDLQPPAHAAGEGRRRGASRRSHRPTISSTCCIRARRRARDCDAVELGVQAQVLLGGQVAVERRVLEDEADVAAHVVALARRRRGRRRARCRRSAARACRAC